jgi:hypothetical protein
MAVNRPSGSVPLLWLSDGLLQSGCRRAVNPDGGILYFQTPAVVDCWITSGRAIEGLSTGAQWVRPPDVVQ